MNDWRSELWYSFNYCLVSATFTLGFSFRSTGSRNMLGNGPVLLLANHESFLDPLAVGLAVRRRIHYLARKTLFQPPWFGSYLSSVGCVPIDQAGVARDGLRISVSLLQAGRALLIFPEGERTSSGEMLPFKPGIALVLRKIPVPIIPVGVAGAYESYPRGSKFPRLSPLFWPATGTAIATSVGAPIYPDVYSGMNREQLLSYLFDAVAEQVRNAERLVRK